MPVNQSRCRKIPTRRGDCIVSWEPQPVDFLFRSENLTPADLSLVSAGQARGLIRELFLLGASDDAVAAQGSDRHTSLISQFARGLLDIYSQPASGVGKVTERVGGGATAAADIDTMQARLVYLVNRCSFSPSPACAGHVIDQLDALSRHPFIELLPEQQRVYASLLNLWRSRTTGGH